MNEKLKQIGIPFILMLIIDLGIYISKMNVSESFSPQIGLLIASGLIFGPYGAVGSVVANIICDCIKGTDIISSLLSGIVSFGVSYLAYKLWYVNYKKRNEVTQPKLNNTPNLTIYLEIILLCGALYSILHGKLAYLIYPGTIPIINLIEILYFLNMINASFIMGIIGIWLSNKYKLTYIPKTSKKEVNEKLYKFLIILLILSLTLTLIIDCCFVLDDYIVIIELITVSLILFAYLTKPITSDITVNNKNSTPEEIMNIFLLITLFIMIIGIYLSYDSSLIAIIQKIIPLTKSIILISMILIMDILLLIFFIPSLAVLRYIEIKVIEPIVSFSKIKSSIRENEKIDSERLLNIYSRYINKDTEIGTLARSYTDLINYNNSYIENIHKIESEKERINAELDIATKIQASALPTEKIENNDFIVNGYSHPAKEVGGDFFDYYMLDENNLAIVIGDVSDKGVPAALVAMTTQKTIKQILKHEHNPSKVLYQINNELCENNPESMFLTLWLGIYNKTTKKLIFSNAGHNPPLIKENDEFKYLNIDSEIALGVFEDYDYVLDEINLTNEIILYTDGITDATNKNDKMYGEDRLLNFFNEFESDKNPIIPLLNDIHDFTKDAEQYDDMTLLCLKIKND
ncbi:PP2C family protein-serine/threonine phosphatase [uncultured Methanobrevibacter sp.]|uniref:PP2C family protein-serine/threonine phosphatase n=1 Tax=uncultured Methanobrevibacter sp. TaxID=253161 RepID=UPI0025EBF71A|nr:PP2C family protein-serine/threonine phosphatase [uncultured Methanobrevibacter sp.]